MNLQKWNEVLVDWVNCFALTNRIKDIGELEDGKLFRILLKKLISSEELVEFDSDSFGDIYSLLEKEFPRYGVREIERVDKLSYITSLILLLSVTKDNTPMFRSNLCEVLCNDSQVKIKYFLESCLPCADELNHEYLKSIIGDIIQPQPTSPPTKVKERVLVDTPMKGFFDSPRLTNKLTRDLKRLEAENESLLIEKMELEDELRIEKEKRERIEDNLLKKREQVSRLREELHDITQHANAGEENNRENISCQFVNALKSEIRELEKKLIILQEKNTILSQDKMIILEKMSILESKCNDLEFQAVCSEKKMQELKMKESERDQETSLLKERCWELEEKINALPSRHNMSIESDSSMVSVSSSFAGERLSYAVVDLKLAEVEEENEKLKGQVKMLIDERYKLTDQLKDVKGKLEMAGAAQDAATAENAKIQSQLVISYSEINQLQECLNKASTKLSEHQELNDRLNHSCGSVRNQLMKERKKCSELNECLEEIGRNILNKVKLMTGRIEDGNQQDSDLPVLKKIQNSMQTLQMHYKETVTEMQQEVSDLREKLETMYVDMETVKENNTLKEKSLQELRSELTERENLIQSFERTTETIVAEKKELESSILFLRDNVRLLEETKEGILKENSDCKIQLLEYENKTSYLEIQLKKHEKNLMSLTDELSVKNCLFEKTMHEIKSCQEKLEILEKERDSIGESISLKEKENHELIEKLKNKEDTIASFEESSCLKEEAIQELNKQLFEQKTVVHSLESAQKALEAEKEQLQKEVKLVNSQLLEKESLTEQTKQEISTWKNKLGIMQADMENVEENNALKEKTLQELRSELSEQDVLIQSFKRTQEAMVAEKKELESSILFLQANVKLLEETKEGILKENSDCKIQLLEYENKTSYLGLQLKEHEKNLMNLTDELSVKQCLVEKTMNEIMECKERIDIMKKDRDSVLTEKENRDRLTRALDEMEMEKQALEKIVSETRHEVEGLHKEKENLTIELQSMTARCSLLENKLEISDKQVELAVQSSKEEIQRLFEKKLEFMKDKLRSQYMDLLRKFEEENQMRKKFEESSKKYRSLNLDYEKKLSDATARNQDLQNKVQSLKHQKSCLEMKLRETNNKIKMDAEFEHRDSLDPPVHRSQSADQLANYFSRRNTSSAFHTTSESKRNKIPENIRESVQNNLPSGQVFGAEDEEGELFNSTFLSDLKEGKCVLPETPSKKKSTGAVLKMISKQSSGDEHKEDPNRLTELMRRNTLCLPHLKSCYPIETQFQDPKKISENFPKGNFSLKARLLGDNQSRRLSGNIIGDSRRRKYMRQTTYMKPEPPTPEKNHRTSLQGSEQGSEQVRINATPGRFRSWFGRGKQTVPNGDAEIIPITPRTKQTGFFLHANLDRDVP